MRSFFVAVMLFSILLAGCGDVQLILPVDPTATVQPTLGVLEDEPAGEKKFSGICAYVWETRSLPEVDILLAKASRAADMLSVEIEASAYGENCVDIVSNYVVSYTPRQTNYSVTVQVRSVDDRRAMGDWIMRVSNLIEETPGAIAQDTEPGKMEFLFRASTRSLALSLEAAKVSERINQGLRGTALFDSLDFEQQP